MHHFVRLNTYIRVALFNLFSSKLRSFLAVLGILVGTASVVTMILSGEIATNEAIQQFKLLGTDLLGVSIMDDNSNEESSSHDTKPIGISRAQINSLLDSSKEIIRISPYISVSLLTHFNGQIIDANVIGVTEDLATILHIHMQEGRFISNLDKRQYYCVIGKSISDKLQEHGIENPLGQQLQIGKTIFTIIGIATPWIENSFANFSVNNVIMVPLSVKSIVSKSIPINDFIMLIRPESDITRLEKTIEETLSTELKNKRFYFRSPKELIEHMKKQSEIFNLLLALIGSISLLVGGIGVMNIMLVTVIERQREIGIRLAVGATPHDIRYLFLIESIILSLIGGITGVILGILLTFVVTWFCKWKFVLFIFPPIVGFTVSGAVGVFFGFYPAHKAAQLNPIEALR